MPPDPKTEKVELSASTPPIYCTACGSQNPREASFCWHCGTRIVQQHQSPSEDAPSSPEPVVPTTMALGNSRCVRCGVVTDADGSFCNGCGKGLEEADQRNFVTGAQFTQAHRDTLFVYPRLPPLSPRFCWASVPLIGLGQMIFGQYAKGLAMLGAAFLLGMFTGGISFLLIAPVAVFDAYRVGRALQQGKAVRKWQFFP